MVNNVLFKAITRGQEFNLFLASLILFSFLIVSVFSRTFAIIGSIVFFLSGCFFGYKTFFQKKEEEQDLEEQMENILRRV